MQKKSISQVLMAAGVLLLGFNQTASAHTIANGALGPNAAATDYYQVNCTTTGDGTQIKTHHLFVNVQDKTGDANLVGVSVFSANAGANLKASTTVDPIGGITTPAAAATSPNISLVGGEGNYVLAVFKTASGLQTYSLTAHCEDVTGLETNAIGLNIIPATTSVINNQ